MNSVVPHLTKHRTYHIIVTVVSRVCAILADATVVCVTWKKTFSQWREGRTLGMPLRITNCLLRDGTCAESPVLSLPALTAGYRDLLFPVSNLRRAGTATHWRGWGTRSALLGMNIAQLATYSDVSMPPILVFNPY